MLNNNSNQWKRYLVMNTTTAPAAVQCKVEKEVSKRPLIDLASIPIEENHIPTFEEIMKQQQEEF